MAYAADNAALDAALGMTETVIRDPALFQISDTAAGTFRLYGAYKIDTDRTDNILIDFIDGAGTAVGTNGVRVTLAVNGTLAATPAVAAGSGISISGTPFYWKSGDGLWMNFNVLVVLDADEWSVQIDPSDTLNLTRQSATFRGLKVERTA